MAARTSGRSIDPPIMVNVPLQLIRGSTPNDLKMLSPFSATVVAASPLTNNCEGSAAVNGRSDKLFIRFRLFIDSDFVIIEYLKLLNCLR
jgi:hypothetical protein